MRRLALGSAVLSACALSAAGGAFLARRPAPAAIERPVPDWHAALERARSSAEAGTPRAEALALLDTSEDEVALAEAIALLGFVAQPEDAELLASFALSRDPVLAPPAVEALGRLGTDEAVDHLLRLIDAPPATRGAAVAALGRSRHPEALDRLPKLLLDAELAPAAAAGLAAHGGPVAALALGRALAEVELAHVPSVAGALVSMSGSEPSAEAALERALDGARTGRRSAVLVALAQARDPVVFELLVEDLRTAPAPMAGQAAWGLGALGDPRAVPILRDAAVSGHAEVRYAAMSGLAALQLPEADLALLDLVDQAPPPIAARAVQSVLRIDAPGVADRLVAAAVARPGDVRSAVQGRLFSAPWSRGTVPEAVLELAREALAAPGPDGWGFDPVALLLRHGTPEDLHRVQELLQNGSGAVRTNAAWSLQQLPGPEAERLLLMLADDPDPSVRGAALTALLDRGAVELVEDRLLAQLSSGLTNYGDTEHLLVRIGSDRGMTALLARVERGTQREWSNAVQAIASSGSREHVERLLAVADRADNPDLERTILSALVYSETADLSEVVDRALRSSSPELESTAAQALARMATPEARRELVDLAGSDTPSTRQAALAALAQVGGPEAEAALVEALNDPDAAWSAVSGLQQLGTAGAREALVEAARGGNVSPEVRASVLHQLPWMAGVDAPELLGDALRDEEAVVRSSALSALESLGSTRAAESIARVLDDPEASDADLVQAASSLQRLGGEVAERHRARIEALAPKLDTGLR